MSARHQTGHHETADVVKDLRRENDARHFDGVGELFWAETGEKEMCEWCGEDHADDDAGHHDEAHGRGNERKQAVCAIRLIFGHIGGEEGDEGDGHRAAGQKIVHDIGQRECGIIGVCRSTCASLIGDDGLTNESEQSRT